MTAILFDGFDHGDLTDRWTSSNHGLITSPVRTGTRALQVSSAGLTYLALDSIQEDDVMYCGFGFNNIATGLEIGMMTFSEGFGTTQHVGLVRKGPIRGWEIRRGVHPQWPAVGSAGTTLGSIVPNKWFPDSWHYIEFGAKIHSSDGWCELRQDGVTILRFDGNTRNGGTDGLIDEVAFGMQTNAGSYRLDDVYILNEQGAVNNSWLGDTRMFPLYPVGNGFYAQWVGSDGNGVDNYLLVDEAGVPVTSDYIFDSVIGQKESFTYQDLPVTLGTARGIEIRTHAAKSDTGTKQLRTFTRRSSTDAFNPNKVLAAIPLYQTHTDLLELDPHAGPGPWTIPNINDSEWGVEVAL